MTYPDKAETMILLAEWAEQHHRLSSLTDTLNTIFGKTPNSLINDAVWDLFEAYTVSVATQLGDKLTWMVWYCWDNEMGRHKKRAGSDATLREIKDLNGLWWLINTGREQG